MRAVIEEISIRDLGVIGEARLPLGPGFTALTGETGAGKTMVVTALGLVLGERADAGAVRLGARPGRRRGALGGRRVRAGRRSRARRRGRPGCRPGRPRATHPEPLGVERGPQPRDRRRTRGSGRRARRDRRAARRRARAVRADPAAVGDRAARGARPLRRAGVRRGARRLPGDLPPLADRSRASSTC